MVCKKACLSALLIMVLFLGVVLPVQAASVSGNDIPLYDTSSFDISSSDSVSSYATGAVFDVITDQCHPFYLQPGGSTSFTARYDGRFRNTPGWHTVHIRITASSFTGSNLTWVNYNIRSVTVTINGVEYSMEKFQTQDLRYEFFRDLYLPGSACFTVNVTYDLYSNYNNLNFTHEKETFTRNVPSQTTNFDLETDRSLSQYFEGMFLKKYLTDDTFIFSLGSSSKLPVKLKGTSRTGGTTEYITTTGGNLVHYLQSGTGVLLNLNLSEAYVTCNPVSPVKDYVSDDRTHELLEELIREGGTNADAGTHNRLDAMQQQQQQAAADQLEESKKQTAIAEEQAETTKGIFGKIADFFGSFFDNIINTVKHLIIPTAEELTAFLQEVNDWFGARLGFVWYPFSLAVDLVSALAQGSADQQLSVPAFRFSVAGTEYTIWEAQTVDLDTLDIFKYVRFFTSALLAAGVVRMAVNKWDEWIGGHVG